MWECVPRYVEDGGFRWVVAVFKYLVKGMKVKGGGEEGEVDG